MREEKVVWRSMLMDSSLISLSIRGEERKERAPLRMGLVWESWMGWGVRCSGRWGEGGRRGCLGKRGCWAIRRDATLDIVIPTDNLSMKSFFKEIT